VGEILAQVVVFLRVKWEVGVVSMIVKNGVSRVREMGFASKKKLLYIPILL
jgi:hypothetical protein